MEYYVELGYLGLFIASFLAATVIPLSSEIVLSVLMANDYDFIACLSFASIGNWLPPIGHEFQSAQSGRSGGAQIAKQSQSRQIEHTIDFLNTFVGKMVVA